LTFHDLRHTGASLMIAAGCHVKVIAEQMGHADGGALVLPLRPPLQGRPQASRARTRGARPPAVSLHGAIQRRDLSMTARSTPRSCRSGETRSPRRDQPIRANRSEIAPFARSPRTGCWVGVGRSARVDRVTNTKSLQIRSGRTWDRTTDLSRVNHAQR
jgi:hypothetical protein